MTEENTQNNEPVEPIIVQKAEPVKVTIDIKEGFNTFGSDKELTTI